jgi:hypothetical protein
MTWFGSAEFGTAEHGMARLLFSNKHGGVRFGLARFGRACIFKTITARRGIVGFGLARQRTAFILKQPRQGKVRLVSVWFGPARHGF